MTPLPQRSQAIDVLRGMTVALMIVVNMSINETYSYGPLLHATWHGLTLTDLVFPTFLFVVGASMGFTLDRLHAQGMGPALRKVATRSVLIFLCGYLLYWYPFFQVDAAGAWSLRPLGQTRIPGVLQRIALCYGLASLIVLWGGQRAAWAAIAPALLLYWVLLSAFGDLSLTGNAVLRLDRALLGEAHLYRGEGIPFDPEGLLSTLPAVVNVLAGYLAAQAVRRHGATAQTLIRLAGAGAVCLVVALAWQQVLPFNKKLWTSSYALCTVGIDLCLLALLTQWIDRSGHRDGTYFFEVFGRNTLFIYLLSEYAMATMGLIHIGRENLFDWTYFHVFRGWLGDKPDALVYALSFMGLCWLVAWRMDVRRLYIRL